MTEKFTVSKEDYENAKLLLEQERINPLTLDEMFKAGIYCILAQAERYDKQIKIYRRLLKEGIISPVSVFEKNKELNGILKKSHYPNMKGERIKNFAGWWITADTPRAILKDALNGHNKGVELRNGFAEVAPAMSYKSASLFMIKCGYEDVIPIDIWVMRFLKEKGHSVKVPDYLTIGGITGKLYLQLEDILRGMAKEADVSLAMFQGALWGKYSTWVVRKERRLF